MTHSSDDLFLGGPSGGPGAFSVFTTVPTTGNRTPNPNPTRQNGVGPLGRIAVLDIVPETVETANLASLQAPTNGVPLALKAGTGITLGTAPDGSGRVVYVIRTPRALSLNSGGNLSAINFLFAGFDIYGQYMTQLVAGPNTASATLKAFYSLLSVTPLGTSATTVSVGTTDVFGLQWLMADATYIIQAKWDSTLAANAGTFVAADATSPATNATGDTRGTFAQAGNPSNGVRRLVISMYINNGQCGANATLQNAIGVPQA